MVISSFYGCFFFDYESIISGGIHHRGRVGEGKSSLVNGEEIVDECLAIGMQNATRVFK